MSYVDVIDNIWYILFNWNTWSARGRALYILVAVGFLMVAIFTTRSGESLQRAARDLRRNIARLNRFLCRDSSIDSGSTRALLRVVSTRKPAVSARGLMELRAGLTPAALSKTAHYTIVILQFLNLI
ncbi:hypothetical protein EVAR_54831_1 [Eumeta japonica]|uniref:Uncharacterized protein n=1 Tax=Eumeta variegata TaxID=151549 RepID=A0A4C1ZI31_EUMVA|nr:hypothetical protein EVAR_54831_1 [Eumeta japonica]